MLTAVKYLQPVGVGVTSPQLFKANDGAVYVVKFQNNCLGPKVLANELLAARLGEYLGLCFPYGDIIGIEPSVLAKDRWLAARVKPGRHFACRYLTRCRYVNRVSLYRAINKRQMAGVMLFDHLFHNVDRTFNRKNLLIRREETGLRLYAIDHSHLFYRGKWTVESLAKLEERNIVNHRRFFGILLKHFLTTNDFLYYAEKVQALGREYLAAVIAGIPHEWLDEAAERQALLTHLEKRCRMAGMIAGELCRFIPDPNRSADPHQ